MIPGDTFIHGMKIYYSVAAVYLAQTDEPLIKAKKYWFVPYFMWRDYQYWLIYVYGYKKIEKPGMYQTPYGFIVHPALKNNIERAVKLSCT